MRILFISHDSSYSGSPLALLNVINECKSSIADFDACVLLLKDGPLNKEFAKLCPAAVVDHSEPFAHKILRKLKLAGEWKPNYLKQAGGTFDVVYSNTVASLPVALEIKAKYGIPVIVHIHEAEYLLNIHNTAKDKLAECNGFVTVSELCKRTLIEQYGINKEKIIVRYPLSPWIGLLTGKNFSDIAVSNIAIEENDFVIGISGATYWLKSDDLLPIIVKRFFQKYSSAQCRFVALGMVDEAINRIKYDLSKAGIADKVSVLGRVDNPLDYYSNFDIVIVPSREESFSLVAQEAALMKKPVVMFRGATGISDILDDSASVQVPYLDIEGYVDAIFYLYTNPAACSKIGSRAREAILACDFGINYMEIFRSCIRRDFCGNHFGPHSSDL